MRAASATEAPEPAPTQKKTMVGLTAVDQAALQKAIEAARTATAAGESPKKMQRRTMMGVAAVSMQQIEKTAAAKAQAVDDDWGSDVDGVEGGDATSPGAPPEASLDDGWGLEEAPEPPTKAGTGPRATVAFSAAALAPPPTPQTRPAPMGRATVGFESAPASESFRIATRAPDRPVAAVPPPPPPASPPREAAAPLKADRRAASQTVAFSAMAPLPSAPATQAPDAGAPRPVSVIAGSSSDPLADTISPGKMRIEEILRETGGVLPSLEHDLPELAPLTPAEGTDSPPMPEMPRGLASTTGPITAPTKPMTPSALAAASLSSTGGLKKSGASTRPPFLASTALAEEMFPTEPGRVEMRLVAFIGGALLLALWGMPVSFSPVTFGWSAVPGPSGIQRVLSFYQPAAGLALLLLGIFAAPYRLRALGALVLGAIPLLAAVGGLGPLEPTPGWSGALLAVGMILLPGALIHRANYRASVLARVLVAVGLVLVFAWMFLPGGSGFVPTMLAGFSSARSLLQSMVMAGSLLLVAGSLLAFMPSATTGGSGRTGRMLLLVRPSLAAAAAIVAGTATESPLAAGVGLLSLLVYGAVASLGVAQMLASVERPAA